jgi:hypothetical protein
MQLRVVLDFATKGQGGISSTLPQLMCACQSIISAVRQFNREHAKVPNGLNVAEGKMPLVRRGLHNILIFDDFSTSWASLMIDVVYQLGIYCIRH